MLEIIGRAVMEMKSLSIPVPQGGHFHDVIFCMMLRYIKGLRFLQGVDRCGGRCGLRCDRDAGRQNEDTGKCWNFAMIWSELIRFLRDFVTSRPLSGTDEDWERV
ncbi:hypothetical protein AVEN_203770-1 [Araneus ventricosus]|uniref:Uncharacterized protein n=1 Tax=Araneus ventricosus TaxID=182803 RepID=A0A4Y2IQQ4_ARAVE|nr:hypothetical protein AVEN_203770-1 [Araneus ventricosus]